MSSGTAPGTELLNVAMRRDECTGEAGLAELMAGYQGGDSEAVEQLVRRLSPLLWRYFRSPHISRSDTEDLLQDCWVRIHRARHTYRAAEPLLPWIFAIARHTRLDVYRRRRRRESRETLVAAPPDIVEDRGTGAQADTARFNEFLDKLPDGQREVIFMLKVSGMSLEEVAGATSSTIGAIKQKAHRAYAMLRKAIEKERQ